jgi:peptide/nickel transport system substrate-binding protein
LFDFFLNGERYNHEAHGYQEGQLDEDPEVRMPMDDRRRSDGEEVGIPNVSPTPAADSRIRLRRGVCGFLCLAAVSFAACERKPEPASDGPIVARIGVPEAEVSAPDMGLPQIAAILRAEGLTSRGFDGRPTPRLAESWTSSPDGLVWRFRLRSGVTFHDGSPLTPEAVASGLKSATANPARLALFPGLADIVSIEPSGDAEVLIRLTRRNTFLIEDLDYPILRQVDPKTTVATGPFKLVTSAPDEIVLEGNANYHQGAPKIGRVVIRPYPTLRTAWASLLRNEIDLLYDVSRDAADFVASKDVALYSYLRNYVYAVALNNARPRLKETAVRRALNAAIDREALIKGVLKGQGVVANGPLPPQHWAYDPTLKGFGFDAGLAGAVLDAAGLKLVDRPDGRRARFSFTCILPEKWLTWERVALDVQKQLYDVGVDMQLQQLPADEFNKRISAGDFDAVMLEMISGPGFSRPYAFWHWGGEQTSTNGFGYRNAAADRWFEAIRGATTDAEYRVAAGELQRTLLDDPPALFLAWSQRTRAVSRRFNVPVEPGRDPMITFWRWTPNERTQTH